MPPRRLGPDEFRRWIRLRDRFQQENIVSVYVLRGQIISFVDWSRLCAVSAWWVSCQLLFRIVSAALLILPLLVGPFLVPGFDYDLNVIVRVRQMVGQIEMHNLAAVNAALAAIENSAAA